MFKISDFARLAQVSAHTLRYYDKIGLFSPQDIDPDSGYRLYSVHQLPQLNRIVVLRDFGCSLAEIRSLLDASAHFDDLHVLLANKESQLANQIADEQARLRRVRARLQLIEHQYSSQDIIVKKIEAFPYFSTGHICEPDATIVLLAHEIHATLHQEHLLDDGLACFIIHAPPTTQNFQHIELGFRVVPTDRQTLSLSNGKIIYQRELPHIELAATTIYQGSRLEVQRGYSALFHWMEANGYTPQGYFREVYLQPGSSDADSQNMVELIIPIKA